MTEPVLTDPVPPGPLPLPVFVDHVFDDGGAILDLVRRHGPYWNKSRYQPEAQRAAAATTPAGHPFAMAGGSPPAFRGDWADSTMVVDGAGPVCANEVLHEAARSLYGGVASEPTFLYVNVTAPMPVTDAGHLDVPSFRGLDRRFLPGWFLLAMQRSGLFERWAVRTATAVVWFYRGAGGALSYWPGGPAGDRESLAAASNTALVGDNDRMFHRVEAVGDPGRWRAVPREALLYFTDGDRWELREGDRLIETYGFEEIRISLSWKAEVFLDEAEQQRRAQHLDDLPASAAVSVLARALASRDLWPGESADIADPRWAEAVMAAYPREVPPDRRNPLGFTG